MRLLAFDLRLRALRIRRRKPNRLSRDTEELRNTDIAHCTLETRANLAHAQSGVRAFVGMIQPGLSEWKSTSPISAWNVGAGEALRLKFFFQFLLTTPIAYAFGLFSCWTYCWTFRSTLNLARLPLKTRSAAMEIREGLVVTPVSATRRFPPTCWHPRRAGTGRAPKASCCWRRHSNSASVCTRIFRATKTS
jgi:hypothetical protein